MEHFIPFVADDQKPDLLIYDGHGSHLAFKIVEAAMENNIKIVFLQPNCSHALQLCLKLNSAHAISGFCNAGIVPLARQKIKHRVTLVSSASGNNDDSKERDDNPSTLQEG